MIAGRHFSTKFIRINVKVAPFFVEKLKVQILPCIIVFVNGISVDRYGPSARHPLVRNGQMDGDPTMCSRRGAWAGHCRIVGFEELGNTDTFTTGALEKRLSKAGTSYLPPPSAALPALCGLCPPCPVRVHVHVV